MKKTFLTLFLLVICFSGLQAQKKSVFYIEAGAAYSTFQDTKYSDVIYSGFGGKYGIGYLKESPKNIWGINLEIIAVNEKPSTHNGGSSPTFNVVLQTMYLRKIKDQLYVGATWDVMDVYFKTFEDLNKDRHFVSGSTLWASGIYSYKKFRFGLDLGLVSYFKEAPGFASIYPQQIVEKGNVNPQDDKQGTVLDFRNYQLKTIPNPVQVRTSIRYQLTKRFSIAYKWRLRKIKQIKNYPSTYGIHSLSVRYNITNKSK
ncbi:MAG: hypothetical protein V3U92_01675 [Cellulophaga sp.]